MKRFLYVILILFFGLTCSAKNATEAEFKDSGYVGTLPDVTKNFQKAEPSSSIPMFESIPEFNSAVDIKPAPRDNPAFVNIILKKEKTSRYINDINDIIPTVEKIATSIEDGDNVQIFAAKVDFLDKNTDYIRRRYEEHSESYYASYKRLMELTLHAKAVSTLRSEAELYAPYLAYSEEGFIYNPNNIEQQLEYLLEEVKDTVIILKDAD